MFKINIVKESYNIYCATQYHLIISLLSSYQVYFLYLKYKVPQSLIF